MTGREPFTGLRFQLLGPLRAWRGEAELDLGQTQQRVVLAVLLLHAGRPVSRDQLVDAVWGNAVPARAANLVQRHVSGLRRVLEPDRPPRTPSGLLTWTEAGYLLTLGPGQSDVLGFDRLIDRAHAARARGDLAATAQCLHGALRLWRGRLCEGLTSPLLDVERDRLAERRLSVLEERIEVDLALGDDFDLVGEVRQLTVEHPLREGLHGLLMLALHRSGRQAEALAAYHRARRLLRDELGIEPGHRLRRLHARILAADPDLDARPSGRGRDGLGVPDGPAGRGERDYLGMSDGPAGAGEPDHLGTSDGPAGRGEPDHLGTSDGPAGRGERGYLGMSDGPAGAREPDHLGTSDGPSGHRRAPDSPPDQLAVRITGPPTLVVPAQLPHPVAGFVGREEALALLDSLLPDKATGGDGGTAVITAIGGTAGVGKTTLAVHWAHRVRDRFPDGQLYVNLRGFDPGGPAVRPAEAIRGFLDALGVPTRRIPVDPDGQIGLYRSLSANRRMLVVLDNAQDTDQVRPLLPGSPHCFTVITSRNVLTGLVITDGAQPVGLGLMSRAEAADVLGRRIGGQRLTSDPDALEDIIASCARLPLALAIVGAHAATHPQLPLASLAKELHAAGSALDLLDGGDAATDVRKVFSWSYRRLTAPAARLFRLLGLHPGPDADTAAVAGLAGLTVSQVRAPLAELTASHLLSPHSTDRYACHDLLRAYAAELAQVHDQPADRLAAARRMLDHYLHSAYRASLTLSPHRDDPITLTPPRPPVTTEDFEGHDEALAWFLREHAVLLSVQRQAVDLQFDAHAWQLAWALQPYFDRAGHWHDSAAAHERALKAARREGSTHGQAVVHGCLAYAYMRLSRYEDVATHMRQALHLYEALGDLLGQAHTPDDRLGATGVGPSAAPA
ncbi:AfsR/SARP family transcriptional regulator [Streptomyces cupreus]|uniref:Winged helix-turn-helix domain-containing protein n=1 Tax=Streptomyces cupreus TaxID=2759956 RepID=A0A7X1JDC7_9ACTN|nr:BTAD domain-containing putative transcriptional regulator [Streptomyces cupreus]MBC2907742.1 winged helix-turn-helix domain-containing protein [Streptomyces cupreus]